MEIGMRLCDTWRFAIPAFYSKLVRPKPPLMRQLQPTPFRPSCSLTLFLPPFPSDLSIAANPLDYPVSSHEKTPAPNPMTLTGPFRPRLSTQLATFTLTFHFQTRALKDTHNTTKLHPLEVFIHPSASTHTNMQTPASFTSSVLNLSRQTPVSRKGGGKCIDLSRKKTKTNHDFFPFSLV